MVIDSTKPREGIFKEFYDVVKNNITTSGVLVTNNFTNSVAQLPQIVIDMPKVGRSREAFGTSSVGYNRDGDIEIMVYDSTVQGVVQLVDDVENAIFSNLSSFGVTNVSIGQESEIGRFELAAKQVKFIILPITFKFKK